MGEIENTPLLPPKFLVEKWYEKIDPDFHHGKNAGSPCKRVQSGSRAGILPAIFAHSAYICDQSFSGMKINTNKYRDKLADLLDVMRISTSTISLMTSKKSVEKNNRPSERSESIPKLTPGSRSFIEVDDLL
ncbi:hypothetical protein TNCV_3685741 [Trichonephila clavipes]|nr:hypothetical protein TNCV_3685741 [Trichonephila clavipes]